MDKTQYFTNLHDNTSELVNNAQLTSQLAQVRAKALQCELLPNAPEIDFTFNTQTIWNLSECIFSDSSLLLRKHWGKPAQLKKWVRISAQAFEFLSRILSDEQKITSLINSSLSYQIAGYRANSQCLAKHLKTEYLDTLEEVKGHDQKLARYFFMTVIYLLVNDVPSIRQINSQMLSLIQESQSIFIEDLKEDSIFALDIYGLFAHAYFQRAMGNYVKYCLEGRQEVFDDLTQDIYKSHKYFQKAQEVSIDVIVSELRTFLMLFYERSTWYNVKTYAPSLLESPVWRTYLRNIAFEKSITEFWPAQLKAIQEDILVNDDSYVVQMPTSAGKTLIAELTILSELSTNDGARCLYIAPYRALVNEIEDGLSDTLGAVGYRVSTLLGGFEFDSFQNFLVHESDVLIATPEKTELLFRTHPEYFENLAVIIVDEGHIVDEGIPSKSELVGDKTLLSELEQKNTLGRGPLLEMLITRLKLKFPDVRFIFLSAVMPEVNAGDFIAWLSREREQPLSIEEEERPSRQVIAKFEWITPKNGELEYVGLPKLSSHNRSPWVPYFIQRKQYLTGELTPIRKQPERKSWPDVDNKAQTTAMLAARFAKSGPVLVFCAQKSDVETVVEKLITSLQYLEASEELLVNEMKRVDEPDLESYYLAINWLGTDHLLTQALRHSVALHYGPLPDPLRQSIEDEFRQGKIKVLVSTNTLGQGVNLPVKTVIIYSLVRQWNEPDENGNDCLYRQKIKKRDFWNICGRAGRAGRETEGQIIFVVNSPNDRSLFYEFTNRDNLEQVHSALFKLLEALIERRIDQESLLGYLDSQALALIAEEVIDTEDEVAITQFLQRSLVGVQSAKYNKILTPLVATVQRTVRWINEQVPESLLRIYSSTGLRVNSCKALEDGVELFLREADIEMLEIESQKLKCNPTLLRIAFQSCDDLPEMRLAHTIEYEGPQDEFSLVSEWVKGTPIAQIRAHFWENGQSQNLSQYISDRLMYKLPWGFNGFLRILAFKLGKEYHDLPLSWQQLPSMLKAGVDNVFSCWAFSLGAPTRSLALQTADLYPQKETISFIDFLRWLSNLPPDFFIYKLKGLNFEKQRFANQVSKLMPDKELLEFIRTGTSLLSSPVRGIPYENRGLFASQVRENDKLILEHEPENPFDSDAIRVVHRGNHIGYVERSKAKVLSREIKMGRTVSARAEHIRPPTDDYPFPWIDMKIQLDRQ